MRGGGGRVLRKTAVGAPGAAATGVARALTSNGVNPGLAGVPINKWAWLFDGAALAVGAAGAIIGAATGEDDWAEATGGVLQSGVAYLSEDATHEINRRIKKPAAGATPPGTVLRVVGAGRPAGIRVNRVVGDPGVAAAGGGASLFGGV